jgi:DNA-binding MarR family transcriptional regulator
MARAPGRRPETPTPARGRTHRGDAALADRLHRAAIHLIRRLRKADAAAGLSPPQASALSVLVFGGPRTLIALAHAEQVRAPTMSRLVAAMEREGLATKTADGRDRRVVHVAATELGRTLLEAARSRRLALLERELSGLPARERAMLSDAAAILERLNRMGTGAGTGPAAAHKKEPPARK